MDLDYSLNPKRHFCRYVYHINRDILDLFNNPVGCLTSLAVFQAKALQNRSF
jgi:hypothetical protein